MLLRMGRTVGSGHWISAIARALSAARVTGDGTSGEGRPPDAPDPSARWAARGDEPAVRDVVDPATGRRWRVWAAATAHVPGAPAADCLMFDAGEVVRRVWGVPPGWQALSTAALLALADMPPAPRPRRDPDGPAPDARVG